MFELTLERVNTCSFIRRATAILQDSNELTRKSRLHAAPRPSEVHAYNTTPAAAGSSPGTSLSLHETAKAQQSGIERPQKQRPPPTTSCAHVPLQQSHNITVPLPCSNSTPTVILLEFCCARAKIDNTPARLSSARVTNARVLPSGLQLLSYARFFQSNIPLTTRPGAYRQHTHNSIIYRNIILRSMCIIKRSLRAPNPCIGHPTTWILLQQY